MHKLKISRAHETSQAVAHTTPNPHFLLLDERRGLRIGPHFARARQSRR